MKKKLVVAAVVAILAALPCFAEIRVDRCGKISENFNKTNVAIYWNDKYDNHLKISAQEFANGLLEMSKIMQCANVTSTVHFYMVFDKMYQIQLFSHNFNVSVVCSYAGSNYSEILYNNTFYSYNEAKAKFDSLCNQYYNKIPK